MSKMADITIPVFDGEDYGSWKKRITMFLKMKKCDVVITREKINTDKEDDWLDISRETVAKPERVAEAPGSIAGTKEEREVEADIVKVLKDEVITKPSIGREDEINSGAVTELLV
ncbi:hypothetical protein KM043_018856 [Ampulex compressa]|nr:hypothetical protein KM043_018856 [Ampulex compressa]